MGCTDSEMVVASQIARMDFDPALLADGGCSVGDIIEEEKKHADKERKKELEKLEARLKETPGAENSRNWIIRDVCDDQRGSGMYACLLETSPGEAVLAFRCSESDTPGNVMKDWVLSDLGLLNHMLTPQQLAAEAYTEEVYRKYGSSFRTFSFSGHSLGGNLAEHAAITASAGMREKIGTCRNLDGPGFSGAYLTAHAGEIAETAGRIRHDRWSLVGNLLNAVPGTRTETVTAVTPEMGNPLRSFLWRHDTRTLIYDKNGNFVSGVQDPLARGLSSLSRKLDFSLFVFSRQDGSEQPDKPDQGAVEIRGNAEGFESGKKTFSIVRRIFPDNGGHRRRQAQPGKGRGSCPENSAACRGGGGCSSPCTLFSGRGGNGKTAGVPMCRASGKRRSGAEGLGVPRKNDLSGL